MSESNNPERLLYTIFVLHNPPQTLASNQNLVQDYLSQLSARRKDKDWTKPFIINDDDTKQPVAVYSWSALIGIVQGGLAPRQEG